MSRNYVSGKQTFKRTPILKQSETKPEVAANTTAPTPKETIEIPKVNDKWTMELRGIHKEYRQGRSTIEVLKGINLIIKPGELIGIIGASGSGKSTLLQIAGLLDTHFSGDVLINGVTSKGSSQKFLDEMRLKHLGFIYQYHHLLSEFDARENVAMPLIIAGKNRQESLLAADRMLDRLGLSKRTFNHPGELSGGEQQRVAIARSLIHNPKFVLADEPTGNLDYETSMTAIQLFIQLAKEQQLSAIIVTHNPEIAAKMDKVYRLTADHVLELA